jgi:hypothetical protein
VVALVTTRLVRHPQLRTSPSLGGIVKSLLMLWEKASEELGSWCQVSTVRDAKTLRERSRCEGLSFLTITLPQFCSDFEKSLDSSSVASDSFAGFKRRRGLPCFLRGFLCRIFSSDGCLLQDPDVDAIQAVRQLTLMFGKIRVRCSPKREFAALQQYLECEQDVKRTEKGMAEDDVRDFGRVGRLLCRDLFTRLDLMVHAGELVPKHGPGFTADGLTANRKYDQAEWTRRLEEVFPALEYILPSPRYWMDLDRIDILEPGQERPVKVVLVPKTLKTPRVIAMEPTCMQFVQQALLAAFRDGMDKDRNLSMFVSLNDQVPNQELSRRGSLTGDLSTLDLSEASDRVSNQLVRELTKFHPWLSKALDATRSRKAVVLGKTIRLAKYASMGSATCFPIETLVFLTCVFVGIERSLKRPLRQGDLYDYRGSVRVYGDDIIVPNTMTGSVIDSLETYGFKVNRRKSFWTGRFRESCGREYFAGEDVSIVRVRTYIPSSRKHARELVSTVALRNNFFLAGMWKTAQHLDRLIGGLIDFPAVLPTSPCLGRYSFLGYDSEKQCRNLHRPMVRGFVISSRSPRSPLGGLGALQKFFLKRGVDPHEKGHLERAGRPRVVGIKRTKLIGDIGKQTSTFYGK